MNLHKSIVTTCHASKNRVKMTNLLQFISYKTKLSLHCLRLKEILGNGILQRFLNEPNDRKTLKM